MSVGFTNSSIPMWMPTISTIRPSAARSSSARNLPEKRAPNWAPTTPPLSSRTDRTMSTVWLRPACRMVVMAVVMMIWNRLVPTTTPAFMRRT